MLDLAHQTGREVDLQVRESTECDFWTRMILTFII